MPVHFAAARSTAHSPIARALARKALARAVNDNGDAAMLEAASTSFDSVMRAALMHFAEHGMGAALNGMSAHGGVLPYSATFLVFSDYMKPAIRLGALMGLRVVYVFTHDSIAVGEDGPTHQPVEHLAALRCIPNLLVVRTFSKIYGLAGESSCGKSTLIKTIAGAIRPPLAVQGGSVEFNFGARRLDMYQATPEDIAAIRWRRAARPSPRSSMR